MAKSNGLTINQSEDVLSNDAAGRQFVYGDLGMRAEGAAATEHSLSTLEAIILYRRSILWSLFFCIGQLMTAFDPQLVGNLFAMPQFQRDFGYQFEGGYIVSAPWQTGLLMGGPIGQVVGSLGAGYPLDWFGRKKTFGTCVVATTGCLFIQFFARSLPTLLAGELLGGLVLGFYAVITPTYASEVSPVVLRGVVTSNINLFIVVGQLLANGVCAGTQRFDSHWAYSGPFATQWIWPVIIILLLPFAPESKRDVVNLCQALLTILGPWWLLRKGNVIQARRSLKKMVSRDVDIEPLLAMIIKTGQLEREMETGSSYGDIFRKANRRRTEICTGVYTIQVFTGIYLIGYGVYFFEQAGLPTYQAFNMGLGFLAVGVLGTCLSWVLIIYCRRRTIYNGGLALLAALQLVIGVLDCAPNKKNRPCIIWAQASMLVFWNFFYNLTIGPVGFSILCESSAMQVREKTIAFATAVQAVVGIGMTVAVPYMINPDQADLGGKLGFFFGGLATLCFGWAYFRVPETVSWT